MTGPVSLVSVSVRTAAAAAVLLVLGGVLASCGDAEEDVAPQATATASPAATVPASPTPLPATATSPGATPEPGWTEYNDAQVTFSISRPASLSLAGEETATLTGGGKVAEAKMRILTFRTATGIRAIDIGIVENPSGLSLNEWIDGYDPCASDYDLTLPQRTDAVVGGYAGINCPVDQLNQINPRVYVAAGGYVFVFVANLNGLPESSQPAGLSQAAFERVLSSFRFPG